MTPERLVHHELCFGCGRTNLFGLLMELEPIGESKVRGRGFIKQDHQGALTGRAHDGIVAAALSEAMAFAAGRGMQAASIALELQAEVPIGTFIEVEAHAVETARGGRQASATARVGNEQVARATGVYRAS